MNLFNMKILKNVCFTRQINFVYLDYEFQLYHNLLKTPFLLLNEVFIVKHKFLILLHLKEVQPIKFIKSISII